MLIRVAVPVPQLGLLTYDVPPGSGQPTVGARVVVPLGARVVTGIVADVSPAAAAPADGMSVKPIRRLLDDEPFLPAGVVTLAAWTAEYYAAGVGETLTAILPPKTRGAQADAHKTQRIASLTSAGLEAVPMASGRQRELLNLLAVAREGLPTSEISAAGISAAVVARAAGKGHIALRHARVDRDPFAGTAEAAGIKDDTFQPLPDLLLTGEQQQALTRLEALANDRTFHVALVHGVTGSGKTEVYRRLAMNVVASGRQVLMMVPEIALTPAVAQLLRATFGTRVAIQHSGLSDGERHDQWQRIRRGEVSIVIGTRSAVFAPLEHVGLIIVDEEHDSSYKQDEAPRYHGRDVAIVRARQAGALVVLGSATPSIESYFNASRGRYELLKLERRVLERPLASVSIVDMRSEFALSGPDVVLSGTLVERLYDRLGRGEQSLVLLNRRGFATAIFCRQCAGTVDCPNCSVSLVVHGEGKNRRMRCHYCNFAMEAPRTCPKCKAPYMEQAGYGTERVESEVRRLCPDARVARLDRDSTRRKGSLVQLLTRFRDGEIDVLVGTQMIAKGHDFPNVTLVGVVSADVGLGMADFRAAERTFQLLTQVAGRAGRGERPGEAIVQTLYSEHYSIRLACNQDYPAFYDHELRFRRAMRYPPVVALINLVVRAKTLSAALQDAAVLTGEIKRVAGEHVGVLGPAPAALARLRGEYRAQILAKGTNRRAMREAVQAAIAARPAFARRLTVDVDPLSVV